MQPYTFEPGSAPLLVSMPHAGTHIPDDIALHLTPAARSVPDTDWHLPRLYDFLAEIGASVLTATHSRFVIDLNRDPAGTPLYPGASNTELCPTALFDDTPIYLPGKAPDAQEIARRREAVWDAYHQQIAAELARLRSHHGIAVLFDAHSIRSRVPRFFEGTLPDLNLGTGGGTSADPALAQELLRVCRSDVRYTSVLDGRFKGGYITRHYGRPPAGVHAVQLEIAQSTYMHEAPPFEFDESRAHALRPLLRAFVRTLVDFAARAAH